MCQSRLQCRHKCKYSLQAMISSITTRSEANRHAVVLYCIDEIMLSGVQASAPVWNAPYSCGTMQISIAADLRPDLINNDQEQKTDLRLMRFILAAPNSCTTCFHRRQPNTIRARKSRAPKMTKAVSRAAFLALARLHDRVTWPAHTTQTV